MQKRVRVAVEKDTINEDRISELPEHIRHHIISYLFSKQAAATAILSRSWKNLWLTLPCLRLEESFFFILKHQNQSSDHSEIISHQQFLLNKVDDIFTRRSKCTNNGVIMILEELKLHIPTLNLTSTTYEISESLVCLVNKLILRALNEFRVKKLNFSIGNWKDYHYENFDGTNLPISCLTSWDHQVITELKLRGCMLNSCVETRWPTLRCLSLKTVNLNQQVVDSITTNCILLESLKLIGCRGEIDTLHASSLKTLVTLDIFLSSENQIKKIELDNPNLERFRFDDVSGRVRPCVIHDLASSKGLIKLDVCDAILTDIRLHEIDFGHFPKLRKLFLARCYGLKCVKISNRVLKDLNLIYTCTRLPLEELEIMDAPALQKLSMNPGTPRVKLHLKWNHENEDDTHNDNDAFKYENIVKFLGNFVYSKFRVLLDHLEVHFIENLPHDVISYYVVPPGIRKRIRPPLLGGCKDLKLNYVANFWKKDDKFEDLLDGLFWLFSHPNTVIIELLQQRENIVDSKELKFEYAEDYDRPERCDYCEAPPITCLQHSREKCDLCETLTLRCWRHNLDKVPREKCEICEALTLRCWRHNLDKVTIINKLDQMSPISRKHDAEAVHFFKTATKSRNVQVNVSYL